MSNSSHSKQELIATAVAAATAGAAIAYAAIKSQEKKVTATYKTLNNRMSMNSLIVNDSSSDPRLQSDILFPHNHEEKMKRRIAQRVSVEEENKTPRNSVTVRVPATSANVGPGCKCISFLISNLKTRVRILSSLHFCTNICPSLIHFHRRLYWNGS
jgi:homoserine kinase